MLQKTFDSRFAKWKRKVNGKYLDLDGYPPQHPYQCHDVWLSFLTYVLKLTVWDGHAAGIGYTSAVWQQFTRHRPNLGKVLTKHKGAKGIRAGDVLFWAPGDPVYPESHVAVALGPARNGTVYCMTQNPGPTHKEILPLSQVLGYLRPIITAEPKDRTLMKKYIRKETTDRLVAPGRHVYLRMPNSKGKADSKSVVSTAKALAKNNPTRHYTVSAYVNTRDWAPGDEFIVDLVDSAGKVLADGRGTRYVVGASGQLRVRQQFDLDIKRGKKAYLRVYASSKNTGTGRVTFMRTDARMWGV